MVSPKITGAGYISLYHWFIISFSHPPDVSACRIPIVVTTVNQYAELLRAQCFDTGPGVGYTPLHSLVYHFLHIFCSDAASFYLLLRPYVIEVVNKLVRRIAPPRL